METHSFVTIDRKWLFWHSDLHLLSFRSNAKWGMHDWHMDYWLDSQESQNGYIHWDKKDSAKRAKKINTMKFISVN